MVSVKGALLVFIEYERLVQMDRGTCEVGSTGRTNTSSINGSMASDSDSLSCVSSLKYLLHRP